MKKQVYITFIALLSFAASWAQVGQETSDGRKIVQITGIVAETDTSGNIPFVNIAIKGTSRGTISDYYGIFSLVAREGDTLIFSCVGYNSAVALIPKTLETDNYYMLAKMRKDTVMLPTVRVGPYNAKTFAAAFTNLKLQDEEYNNALQNLNQEELTTILRETPVDGNVAAKNLNASRGAQMYSAGGLPSPSILNPFAWAQFFKALKQGKFKDPYKDNK